MRSDQILSLRSAVPSVDTHKRPSGITDGVIEPSGKRRKANGVKPKEYERLREVAYGKQSVQDIINKDGDVPSHDPWALDPKKDEQDPRFDYLEKSRPFRAPQTLKETPISLIVGAREVPAVAKPKAGTSYNPTFQDWDKLLTSEGAKEIEAEKKRLRRAQAEKELAERIAEAEREAEREAAQQTEDESAWEGFESDYDKMEWLRKKRPERKTPQERKKVERRKEREREDKKERKEREKEKREKRIAELKHELDQETKREGKVGCEVAVFNDDEEHDFDESVLRRRRFGKDYVPEQPLELVLPDELKDSLRLLKPEGNLLKDRYRNLLISGKLETRKPLHQQKKKRRKMTEKWTYKDFEVPV